MWSVEELSIQHQAQKITVLNVKKHSAPVGRTDGLGLLYMGYQSVFLGKRFKRAISTSKELKKDSSTLDDEIDDDPPNFNQENQDMQYAPELETILDTGGIKLMKESSCVSDHQVQTDLSMPIWVLNNVGKSAISPQLDFPIFQNETEISESSRAVNSLSLKQNDQITADLSETRPVDLNACQQFSVIHYENLTRPKGKSMVMVQTQNKNQKSIRMFDVTEEKRQSFDDPNNEELEINDEFMQSCDNKEKICEEKKQFHLPLNSSAEINKEKNKHKKSLPTSIHNKHGYTCQYEQLDEQNLSPCSTRSTSSYHTSPDTSHELSSPEDTTSSSVIGLSSESNSPLHVRNQNVIPSHSVGSDMVSLLSTPSEELNGCISPDGELSIWDSIQRNTNGSVAPEEFALSNELAVGKTKAVSLVADIEELNSESVSIPLKSIGDKPAISYKAYKVDMEANSVVLSKAKIATYLPLMHFDQPAIEDEEDDNCNDELLTANVVVGIENRSMHHLPVIHENAFDTEACNQTQIPVEGKVDSQNNFTSADVSTGQVKVSESVLDYQTTDGKDQNVNLQKFKVSLEDNTTTTSDGHETAEVKLHQGQNFLIECNYVENTNLQPIDTERYDDGLEIAGEHRHSIDDTVCSMGSTSDMSTQTYNGGTHSDQQSTTGDETDIYYDADQFTDSTNNRPNNTEPVFGQSLDQKEIGYECPESLTIYMKNQGKRHSHPITRKDGSTPGIQVTGFTSITDKGKSVKKEGILSKTFPVSKRPVTVGLNQLQTVVSRSHQKPTSQQGVGLNQLTSSSPKLRKKPQLHVSLMSPGGSTTSDDEGSPFRHSGSRLSAESDTSPGAYLMASYDDGSDWGDDSLLWNTDSMESLNSYTSDSNYEVVMDCEVHANWMSELPTRLHDVPLTGLVIPGSHISLAIERDLRPDMDISKCNYEMAEFLRKLPNLSIFNSFRSMIKKIWKNWMGKQMLTVSQQLYAGIRYFDLRITKYRSALYAEHGLYSQQLPKYLKEVKLFTETHAKEIVILQFGALNQIDKKDKRRLVTMLFQIFGAKLAKCPSEMNEITLNLLWKRKKQVIIVFPEDDVALLQNHIFSGLIWPDSFLKTRQCNAHTVTELIQFLDDTYYKDLAIAQTNRRNVFHVTRAVLSPDMSLVFGEYQYNSMREMTLADTHPAVNQWLQAKSNLNIVALDFVGKGDLIEQIICLNHSKFPVETVV